VVLNRTSRNVRAVFCGERARLPAAWTGALVVIAVMAAAAMPRIAIVTLRFLVILLRCSGTVQSFRIAGGVGGLRRDRRAQAREWAEIAWEKQRLDPSSDDSPACTLHVRRSRVLARSISGDEH